ncbi:putative Transmembrane protein 50a [Zostera marina]|uniref:Putative Transmembrane protein 50a n=1 Tax=Zostera marina TaxID=29655 RepID=A0A0K9Q5E1_ZOSMR|nr:putative Transmembrane protein 50a [Zostera marina]
MLKFSFFFSSTLTVCRSPSEPRRSSDSYRFLQSFTLSRTHTFDFPRPFMDYSVLWGIIGPGISGAVFGAGWWFWVDAVVCSFVKVPFVHYLPGIFASFAALMFNCVKKDDMDYSPYEEGQWRLKLWLFLAYVVSFVSLAASAGLLAQDALTDKGPSSWTGTAGVVQCVLVLVSGLMFWTSEGGE